MIFEKAHYRLKEWGQWYVDSVTGGLGHSKKNILISALEGSRSTTPTYAKDNERAEEVNKIILMLKVRKPDLEYVLRFEYTEAGSQEEKIRKTGIKRFNYRRDLNLGIAWVESALAATSEIRKGNSRHFIPAHV
jgi:hypothetical protein